MHGLCTLAYLNANANAAAEQNARDPGQNNARRAHAEMSEALSRVIFEAAAAVATETPRNFPPEFSITRHGDNHWVLPLTGTARNVCDAVMPAGTPRYGLHYILHADELGNAIVESLRAAD